MRRKMYIFHCKNIAITCLATIITCASILVTTIAASDNSSESLSTQITRSIINDDITDPTTLIPASSTSSRPTFGRQRFRNNMAIRFRLIRRRRRKTTPSDGGSTNSTATRPSTNSGHPESIATSSPLTSTKKSTTTTKATAAPSKTYFPDRKPVLPKALQHSRSEVTINPRRLHNKGRSLAGRSRVGFSTNSPNIASQSAIMPRNNHESLGQISPQRSREDFGIPGQPMIRGFAQQVPHHPMMNTIPGFFPNQQQNQLFPSSLESGFLPTPPFAMPPMQSLPGYSHHRPIGEDYEDYEFYGPRPYSFLYSQPSPFGLSGTGGSVGGGGGQMLSTAALQRPPVSSGNFGLQLLGPPAMPEFGAHNGLPASVHLSHTLQVNGGGPTISRPISSLQSLSGSTTRRPLFDDTRGRFGDGSLQRSSHPERGGGDRRPNVIEVESNSEWAERPRGVLVTADTSSVTSRKAGLPSRRLSFSSDELDDLGLAGRRSEGSTSRHKFDS